MEFMDERSRYESGNLLRDVADKALMAAASLIVRASQGLMERVDDAMDVFESEPEHESALD